MQPNFLSDRSKQDVPAQPAWQTLAAADEASPLAEPRDSAAPEFLARRQLLRLLQWPDMCAVAPQHLNNTARVCALLANRPMQAYLVPLRLGIPGDQVALILSQLMAQGVLRSVGEPTATELKPQAAAVSAIPAKKSVWDKLLHKLLNR